MKRLLLLICLLSSPAIAQQQTTTAIDPARAIAALQGQRNAAMDAAAIAEAKAAGLSDELAKAQARIKEMETKSSPADATVHPKQP